jgi:hypothetical protein
VTAGFGATASPSNTEALAKRLTSAIMNDRRFGAEQHGYWIARVAMGMAREPSGLRLGGP